MAKKSTTEPAEYVEPAITKQNIDPAFAYEVTRPEGLSIGFIVRVSHDPQTKQWIEGTKERRRFFVVQPAGENTEPYCITIAEAFKSGVSRSRRLTPSDTAIWESWMSINYVKA